MYSYPRGLELEIFPSPSDIFQNGHIPECDVIMGEGGLAISDFDLGVQTQNKDMKRVKKNRLLLRDQGLWETRNLRLILARDFWQFFKILYPKLFIVRVS